MKYKLTVVTTTYNQEKYIKECLDGIVKQETSYKFKAIISDDGSTDNTRKIIKEYQKKYPEIIFPVFNKKNLGAMGNFVETLNMADTEYVALCDGDDFWTDSKKLDKQISFLENNKDYNIVFHQTKIFFQDHSKEDQIYPDDTIKDTTTFEDIKKLCYMPANTVVYRWKFQKKDSFKKAFPANIVPGDYFVHLLHAKDGEIKYFKEIMSCYRRHEEGMWWETSDPSKQHEFYLKYGLKYLNFYEAIKKTFNLNKNEYAAEINYMVSLSVDSYLLYNKFDELKELSNKYPDKVSDRIKFLISNSTIKAEGYETFGKFRRILYQLLFEPKKAFKKIECKFKKRK